MANIELTSVKQLEEYVSKGYSVVDCYGDFCTACDMLAPVLGGVEGDMAAGIHFGKVNVSQIGEVAERYGVNALPTLLFFRDGEEVHRAVGSMDREELNRQFSIMLYQ